MENPSTLASLASHFVKAILPLGDIVSDPELFKSYLYRLGWRVENLPPEYARLAADISDLKEKLEAVIADQDPVKIAELTNAIIHFIQEVRAINVVPAGIGSVDHNEFLQNFESLFLDLLLADYLLAEFPELFNLCRLLGIIELNIEPGSNTRSAFQKVKLNLDRIPAIIEDPLKLPKFIYGWNSSEFNFNLLIQHLDELFSAVGITTYIELDDGQSLRSLAPSLTLFSPRKLVLPVLLGYINDQPIELLLEFIKWPSQNGNPPGLVLVIKFPSELINTFQFSEDLALKVSAKANADLTVGFIIQGNSLDIISPLATSPIPFKSDLGISFEYKPAESSPILGSADGSRVDLKGGTLAFDILPFSEEIELRLRLELQDLSFSLNTAQGDSFVNQITGGKPIAGKLSLDLQWSSVHGINFAATGLLEWIVPSHIDLGFVTLESFNVQIKPTGNAVPALLQTNVTTSLGPLNLRIQDIGLEALVTFPDNYSGNLGLLDLDIGFKPPAGLGLSIDGGGFTGGGFLRYVEADQRYEGMLELEYQDQISLKAIGLLTTRLPGGQPGFSLLIIITAEFTPMQLGLGFTLNGVGGLLGLNRTADAERLRSGLRDNTLGSVLFPQNIVENASRILSDLNQLFPIQPNRFIFGPMARIGWGSPTLITIDLGFLVEVPDPVRVLILGVIRALLPDEKAKLLQLQVNFLGVVDFQSQRAAIDASLYDSKLLNFPLSGDMAVRLHWGAEPDFLLTVGGFHPAYRPPPLNLPALRRLSLQLTAGDNPRLTLETYFAVTSNTVQFGAKVELLAKAGSFNAYGFLSFDVLFQFNPFHFIAAISAKVALRVGSSEIASISLDFTLEGPTPWHAQGTAKLKICWFLTIKVHFDKTFGEVRDTRLEDVPVLPLLRAELSDKGNWEAQPAGDRRQLVSLKTIEPSDGQVVVAPFGVLTIQQRVVPLAITIQRFGSQRPADGDRFTIEQVTVGEGSQREPLAASPVSELFAPGQFFELSDAQKLSSKSFERYGSGVKLVDSEEFAGEYAVRREVAYELFYIDEQRDLVPQGKPVRPDLLSFNSWTLQGAVASSPLSQSRNGKSALAPGAVQVSQEGFAVVNASDLRPVAAVAQAESEAGAQRLMDGLLHVNPSLEGELLVVPAFEVNRS